MLENKIYHYRIKGIKSGEEVVSGDFSFTTLSKTALDNKIMAARSNGDLPKIYYVNNDTGDDSNDGLTTATTWKLPSYAASVAEAGDTIYLMNSTWTRDYIYFKNSGIDVAPITMAAYPGAKPTFDGVDRADKGIFPNYGVAIRIKEGEGYINIRGLTIHNYNSGIYARSRTDDGFYSDIHISDCEIYLVAVSAVMFTNINYSSITNCNFHDTGWNIVQLSSSYYSNSLKHILVKDNIIAKSPGASGGSGHGGVDIFQSSEGSLLRIDVISNTIYQVSAGIYRHSYNTQYEMYYINIRNNVIYDVIRGINPSFNESEVANNTIYNCTNQGIFIAYGGNPIIKNNIITNCLSGGAGIRIDSPATATLQYNNVWNNTNNYAGDNGESGEGDISIDPLFVDPAERDFHLKSEEGRCNGSTWLKDNVTSPVIDKGDPSSDYTKELSPNGNRINLGAYGNTTYASKTKEEIVIITPCDTYNTNSTSGIQKTEVIQALWDYLVEHSITKDDVIEVLRCYFTK